MLSRPSVVYRVNASHRPSTGRVATPNGDSGNAAAAAAVNRACRSFGGGAAWVRRTSVHQCHRGGGPLPAVSGLRRACGQQATCGAAANTPSYWARPSA